MYEIEYNGTVYRTSSIFLKEIHEDFKVYEIVYPSGERDEILTFINDKKEIENYIACLIQGFALESDNRLTEGARKLKQDVRKLFNID